MTKENYDDIYNEQKAEGATEKRELSKPSDQDGGFHIVFPLMVRAETAREKHYFMRGVIQSEWGNDSVRKADKFLVRLVIVHSTTPGKLEGKSINPNRETSMLLTTRTKNSLLAVLTHQINSKKGTLSFVDENGIFTPGTPMLLQTEVASNDIPSYSFERIEDSDVPESAEVPATVEIYESSIDEQATRLSAYNAKGLEPQLSAEELASYGVEPEAAPDKAF